MNLKNPSMLLYEEELIFNIKWNNINICEFKKPSMLLFEEWVIINVNFKKHTSYLII